MLCLYFWAPGVLWFRVLCPHVRPPSGLPGGWSTHYIDVIMTTIASQISSLTVVYSIVYSGAGQRKHQSSASLAFVRGIHRDQWIPRTKGQLRGKCFHLMTSSCDHHPGDRPAVWLFIRPVIHLSIPSGYKTFSGERVKRVAWNLVCWCILASLELIRIQSRFVVFIIWT